VKLSLGNSLCLSVFDESVSDFVTPSDASTIESVMPGSKSLSHDELLAKMKIISSDSQFKKKLFPFNHENLQTAVDLVRNYISVDGVLSFAEIAQDIREGDEKLLIEAFDYFKAAYITVLALNPHLQSEMDDPSDVLVLTPGDIENRRYRFYELPDGRLLRVDDNDSLNSMIFSKGSIDLILPENYDLIVFASAEGLPLSEEVFLKKLQKLIK
jgi:hypothetical protein